MIYYIRHTVAVVLTKTGGMKIMVSTLVKRESITGKTKTKKITVFHCFNAIDDLEFLDENGYTIHEIQMPCSSISREIFMLKA